MQMTTGVDTDAHVGLGVFLSQRNGERMFGHDGADAGFRAMASASLDHGYGVVVMANSDNGQKLFRQIENTVAAALDWPTAQRPVVRIALSETQRSRVLGRFSWQTGIRPKSRRQAANCS